jgi:hypothetical protein
VPVTAAQIGQEFPTAQRRDEQTNEPTWHSATRVETGLPPELHRFMVNADSHTLLIRGPPGSGKTTLALSLLDRLAGRRIIVTNRVTAEALERFYPWLKDEASRVEVVDSKARPGAVHDSARTASLLKAQERVIPMRADPSGLNAKDVEQLVWLPSELRQLWLSFDPATPTVVAIDSWDALVDVYLGTESGRRERLPDREELERILLDQVGRANIRLLLILERDTASQLDYLCDGVVSTGVERAEERIERWFRIHKLRGIEVGDRDYPFTLSGARFQCFPSLPANYRVTFCGSDPDPEPIAETIWPGSRAFAEQFGRLHWEQSTLIELERTVSYEVARTLTAPMVTAAIRSGGRVIIAPPPSRSFGELVDLYRTAAPEPVVRERLRIMRVKGAPTLAGDLGRAVEMEMSPGDQTPIENARRDPESPSDPRFNRALDVFHFLTQPASPGVGNLSVGFVPTWRMLGTDLGPEAPGNLGERWSWGVQRYLSGAPLHVILIDRPDDPVFGAIATTAGSHLRVREHAGHMLIHGVRPWTPEHAIVFSETPDADRAPYDLVRIV